MNSQIVRCATAVALVFAAAGASASVSFKFDPTGGGGGLSYATVDPTPGTAYSIGGTTAVGGCLATGVTVPTIGIIASGCSNQTTLLYQANLGTIYGGGNTFTNGSGGNYFTFVIGFDEVVTNAQYLFGTNSQSADFLLAPGGVNFF
jgi:hypothetical protein